MSRLSGKVEQTIGWKCKRKANNACRHGIMPQKKTGNGLAPVMVFSYCCPDLSKKEKKATSHNLA